eukprot:GEMP01025949.1.p1 GENE.GEMP01025949.1~~GEMP01025949.1.p1  ORF type:complete len:643 (+),score=95.04 GEMP01025949.1:77-2005(+)
MVRKRKNAAKAAENANANWTQGVDAGAPAKPEGKPAKPKADAARLDSKCKPTKKTSKEKPRDDLDCLHLSCPSQCIPTLKRMGTLEIIASKDTYTELASAIAQRLGRAQIHRDHFLVYGFPGKKYAFALAAAVLFSFLNSWSLPLLLACKDSNMALQLFAATCVCDVHHYLSEEVQMHWKENLARHVASCYISMPIVKDKIGPKGSVMDPLAIDAVEGYVQNWVQLVYCIEDFVEAISLSMFLWDSRSPPGRKQTDEFASAGRMLIAFTVLSCAAVSLYAKKHKGLQIALLAETSRVRFDFVWHRTQMNNLIDACGYRTHYSFHVHKVHQAIRDFFRVKHAYFQLLLIEQQVYHFLDRVVLIMPLFLSNVTLTQVYVATRLCRRLIHVASKTHVIMRALDVYRAKIQRFVGRTEDYDYPEDDEPASDVIPSPKTETFRWARWTGVDVGYRADSGEVHVVKANITMDFRGSVFIPWTESGKTSVLQTLSGNLPPLKGEASFVFQRKFNMLSGSSKCQMVEGGLLPNVAYPKSVNGHEQEARAMECLRFAALFPDKSIAWVKARGMDNLSSSERQKLALARVFYAKPKIVFLDNATSLLSDEDAYRIYQNLKERITTIVSTGHEKLRAHHEYVYNIGTNAMDAI